MKGIDPEYAITFESQTPLGKWKHLMCFNVDYRSFMCHTPWGVFIPGSKECDGCMYNYENDHIDARLNK